MGEGFDEEKWMRTVSLSKLPAPKARTYHAGCSLGCGMFIHGGQTAFSQASLDDWGLFDLSLTSYI